MIALPGQAELAQLSFSYEIGTFTEEFGEAIGRIGARTPLIVQDEATVGELVRGHCGGGESPAYRRAVAVALRDQQLLSEDESDVWDVSLTRGAEVDLPPCLPEPIPDLAFPIARSTDSISQLYQSAHSWEAIAAAWSSARADFSEVSRSVRTLAPTLAFVTADGKWTSTAIRSDDPTISWESASQWDDHGLSGIGGPTDGLSTSIGPDLYSLSKIRALQQSGVSDTEAIHTVAMARATDGSNQSVADAAQAFERALTLYRPESQRYRRLQQTIEDPGFVEKLRGFDARSYDDIFIGFNPHRGGRSPHDLKVGELIFAPTVNRQHIQIDLAVPNEALDEATRQKLTSDILVDSEVATDAEIQQSLVGVFGIEAHGCTAQPPSLEERRRGADQLSLQLLENRLHDLRENRGARLTSTILVADSGFYYDNRFADVPFRDEHLQSADQHEMQRPPNGLEAPNRPSHGTSVSGLALGGPDLIDRANALGYDLKLDSRAIYEVRRIGRDQAGHILRDAHGEATERLVALAIPKKVKEALKPGNADIVNLSLGGRLKFFESLQFMRHHPALFVVAAGNKGTVTKEADTGVDVGHHDIYPARNGGSRGDGRFNLLTVAALDWNRALAPFSNFGQQEVQIAAFGCNVPTWIYDLDDESYHEARLSGTSFATPTVSYVAGLLIASLPRKSAQPARIKARLLASADLVPTLFKKIEDGRVLNPFKALSLYDDLLEELVLDEPSDPGPLDGRVADEATREALDEEALVEENEVPGEVVEPGPPSPPSTVLHRGRLKTDRTLAEFCRSVSQPEDTHLLKVASHPDETKRGLLRYYWIKDDELELDECEPKEALTVTIETSAGSRVVPWNRVRDIVFRHPLD